MAITSSQTNGIDRVQTAFGSYADDAGSPAAMSVTLGFTPTYVEMVNQTTRVMFQWYAGMTSAHAIKTVAAGTRTAETTGGITVSGGTVTFPAAAQNDQVRWIARS